MKKFIFVKGIYTWIRSIFVFKRSFGLFEKNSSIIPPLIYDHPKNIFIGPRVYIGPRACLSATNARIVFKGHTSVGEDLSIHTGNHARIIGVYHNDISEKIKPEGLDKEVMIEEDVWIGSRVTILMGRNYWQGCNNCRRFSCDKRRSTLFYSWGSTCKGNKVLLDKGRDQIT